MAAMFVNRSDEISNIHRGPSIDASYQVSVQFAKQFQGRRFLEIDQSETRIACDWQPCLHVNRAEMIVPIRSQTWPPQGILFSDWLISKKYFPLEPLSQIW
jgi:hypothetical protein